MSPPVSSCTSAVPGASQSPRCHRARSGCQRLRRGAVLGCTRIFHRSVIPGGQWPWHPAHPHAVPSLLHLYLHPQGGKTRAASGTHVPAYALVSLPPPLLSSQPGGPLWVWAGGAHLDQGSRAGAGGSWVPQESRHRLWMLPMDLVPHLGHAVVAPPCLPAAGGAFAARLPPFALQTLPCPSLPSCHPRNCFAARGGREGPCGRGKRLHLSSTLRQLERGRAGACGCPRCGGQWGEEGWGARGGHPGAVTPTEKAGLVWHLLLLPPGRAWSSLPSRAAQDPRALCKSCRD